MLYKLIACTHSGFMHNLTMNNSFSLLPDRKLKTLFQRPLNHVPDTKDGNSLLLLWYWEECLKQRYTPLSLFFCIKQYCTPTSMFGLLEDSLGNSLSNVPLYVAAIDGFVTPIL